MSFKSLVALFIMANVFICLPAVAQPEAEPQDPVTNEAAEEKTFKLLHDSGYADTDRERSDGEDEIWVPGIRKGTIEVSFALGALNLNTTLLEHDNIIYKYTEENTYWGDIKMKGSNAFNPQFRLGYNVSTWLCLEGVVGVAFADYTSTAENRVFRSNEPGSVPSTSEPDLGEFDLEARSLFTANLGINASVYFLNFDGDGSGRLQPYFTGGLSNMWYSMNSNYVDDATSTVDFNIGGGVRLLADKNISIRLEALYHINSFEFSPSDKFTTLNDGTVVVPLDEFITDSDELIQRSVTEYSSQSLGSLGLSIGLQGSF